MRMKYYIVSTIYFSILFEGILLTIGIYLLRLSSNVCPVVIKIGILKIIVPLNLYSAWHGVISICLIFLKEY